MSLRPSGTLLCQESGALLVLRGASVCQLTEPGPCCAVCCQPERTVTCINKANPARCYYLHVHLRALRRQANELNAARVFPPAELQP